MLECVDDGARACAVLEIGKVGANEQRAYNRLREDGRSSAQSSTQLGGGEVTHFGETRRDEKRESGCEKWQGHLRSCDKLNRSFPHTLIGQCPSVGGSLVRFNWLIGARH
ncbi:unnamed protein product [Toxocara canis]|uniref:Uncharacterized protein n=1 Tax=Toxocara canis TaxID=6265 RepID=A0A183UJA9_TOXCA|nr:unnamed protein product [Toxocara canis]